LETNIFSEYDSSHIHQILPNYRYIPYQINNRMKILEWLNVILDRSKRMLNLGLLRANGAVLVETGTIEEKLVGNMTYF